jgi:flagella synthesis protein FlgN
MNRAAAPGALSQRQNAMTLLLRGVADDLAACATMRAMLEDQFNAALCHNSAALAELSTKIVMAVDAMEMRRQERLRLVSTLLGGKATMADTFALLKGATRDKLESSWAELEKMVIECKRLNARNNALLTEQYSIMQRVLHGEDQIYAPA